MKLSKRVNILLLTFLLILNVVLRIQVIPHEIGFDSFEMHVMINSLNEFGYAKWILHPLSFIGLYPASYSSSMQFLISGIAQTTGMEMNFVIFIYCILIGLLSVLTGYIMAGELINNDIGKFLAAFVFSTLPAVLTYTTWTIPTRGLFMILAPIIFYLLLRIISKFMIKYILLLVFFSIFLLSTHHLFYFLLPVFIGWFIVFAFFKIKSMNVLSFMEKVSLNFNNKNIAEHYTFILVLAGFLLMFSIPFLTRKFVELSRYDIDLPGYVRGIGLSGIFAMGGLIYLSFKKNKSKNEWFILLSMILLSLLIFKVTYMKWFVPLITTLFACVGLFNVIQTSSNKKYPKYVLAVFLIASITISGYYQFLHEYRNEADRFIDESTYQTGKWSKYVVNGTCISNYELLGKKVFSVSETTHFLDTSMILDLTYGFINIDISKYERYPLTSEDFWFSGYEGEDVGSDTWEAVHMLTETPQNFNINYINYVFEYVKGEGGLIWNHRKVPSSLLYLAYDKGSLVYDVGTVRTWKLN